MSCNNWNSCNCNCNCSSGNSNTSCSNKCNNKSEVSDATTGNNNMNMCYRQGYAAGFKDGYETGFRDGFWTASCPKNYGGVMGSTDSGCGCK